MVLLIVDTQNLITNSRLHEFELFTYHVKELIQCARKHGIEVIYVRHDDGAGEELTKGTQGYEIYDGFWPEEGEKIFDKKVNSPFKESGLLEYLTKKEVKEIVVAGLQTDYCIDATVKCGFEHGFRMIVPAYANTTVENGFMSAKTTYEYYNNFIWKRRYAQCLTLKETLELMENKSRMVKM